MKYKKEIIGVCLIVLLLAFGFAQSARLWIGDVTITDTLSGTARFNNDINVEGGGLNLEGASTLLTMGSTASDMQFGYSTVSKDLTLNSNQSSGNLMIFDFPNNSSGAYKFKVAGSEQLSLGTETLFSNQVKIYGGQGLFLYLPTDSMRISDVSKTGTVSNAAGYIKVYVGGEAFYIQLYTLNKKI